VSKNVQFPKAGKRLRPPDQRLLSRRQSADYWGIGEKQFDELVKNGIAPPPVPVIRPNRWDVKDHDQAIDALGGRPKNEEEMALAALDRLRPPLVY
jgi:predicted DNA-binding transcriptional regulator AlpA